MKRSLRLLQRMWAPRYFDIGVNFSDGMFQGVYQGSSPKHPPDLQEVVQRASLFNVDSMLITASTIKESYEHFQLCDENVYCHSTVGVHPCSVKQEFYTKVEGTQDDFSETSDRQLVELAAIAKEGFQKGHIKAFGEIGLDYDRLHYSSEEQQKTMFRKQLDLFCKLNLDLPFFLHMRSACDDFIDIIKPYVEEYSLKGVVHSFTGTQEELKALLALGFYIGVNGCSLKSEENLAVASQIPPERLMIETDAPWCEVRKSHASYKYLTPYPNKFYPRISFHADPTINDQLHEEMSCDTVQKNKNGASIKFDDFLPFPVVKKGNFEKHSKLAEEHADRVGRPAFQDRLGPLAWPLMQSRNEPVFVGQVAQIMCALYGKTNEKDIEEYLDYVYENTCKFFRTEPIKIVYHDDTQHPINF